MEFHTARLTLDALRADDAEVLFRYRADPSIARYQGWCPASIGEARTFIEGLAATTVDTPGSWSQRAIRLRDSGALIGDVGLHFVADAEATVELGISLSPDYQGQGIRSTACGAALHL